MLVSFHFRLCQIFVSVCLAFETTLAEGNRLEKRLFHTTFGLVCFLKTKMSSIYGNFFS